MFLIMYKDMKWSRNVLGYGIGYFQHCLKNFGTVTLFREIFFSFFQGPRADNYYDVD